VFWDEDPEEAGQLAFFPFVLGDEDPEQDLLLHLKRQYSLNIQIPAIPVL